MDWLVVFVYVRCMYITCVIQCSTRDAFPSCVCYSISVLIENRQRGRLAGFSLYVSNSSRSTNSDIKSATLCYKDGPHLPAIKFTTKCIEEGRYVIFYNERLVKLLTLRVKYLTISLNCVK